MTTSATTDSAPFRWLGHGSLFLPGPPAVAIDPWKWRYDDLRADVLLATCVHVDHCCADDLARAAADGARAFGPASALPALRDVVGESAHAVAAGDVVDLGGATLHVLPFVGAGTFHGPDDGVTFGLRSADGAFLFLGTSRAHDAHAAFGADVAFVGVGGLLGPDPDEAVRVAQSLGAAHCVPVQWGDLHGRFPNARRFLDGCAAAGVAAGLAG